MNVANVRNHPQVKNLSHWGAADADVVMIWYETKTEP